ncbi:radical SAM protein [Streptomyces sp. NPDC002659]|uniref:radical SAM protein n=1 Tax=Streptomyces sp. NPDC002659 TaxID=3364656 RepID=UPI0036924300
MATGPHTIIWDVTYACPLRCGHCYSESGRRPSRALQEEDMCRVADSLIAFRPGLVAFAGGEPLLARGVFRAAERIAREGIDVDLYTSGWTLAPSHLVEIRRIFSRVHVSIDGATAQVHDQIRGRTGSFDRALQALTLLDEAAAGAEPPGGSGFSFGIDCTVVQSGFGQLEDFCTALAPRFPHLSFISFDAAAPVGLASRPSYVRDELLTDAQLELLGNPDYRSHLQSLAPSGVTVDTSDNGALRMRPDQLVGDQFMAGLMQVEPDGQVRAMAVYEGTVGSLLTDPPELLWERAVERRSDPFVVEVLSAVTTMKDWAEAARRMDLRFGSAEVRQRIAKRPEYTAVPARA